MKGFLQRILQEIVKKIILGTSDACSMRRSSHQPTTQRIILKIVGFIEVSQIQLMPWWILNTFVSIKNCEKQTTQYRNSSLENLFMQ